VFIDKIEEELPSVDLLILSLPCQFVLPFFQDIKKYLKPGLTILNLAK
jgi:glycerol-3-phosphate dehydrogenase